MSGTADFICFPSRCCLKISGRITIILLLQAVTVSIGRRQLQGGVHLQVDNAVGRSQAMVSGPPFEKSHLLPIVGKLANAPLAPCGSMILAEYNASRDTVQKIIDTNGEGWFDKQTFLKDDGNKEMRSRWVAGPAWKEVVPKPDVGDWTTDNIGYYPLLPGMRLNGIAVFWSTGGNSSSMKSIRSYVSESDQVRKDILEDLGHEVRRNRNAGGFKMHLTFEAGMDLRRCWADIVDQTGNPVCGPVALQKLMSEMNAKEADYDRLGQSGSTLIKNYWGFIVKNVKDDSEYAIMKQSLPLVQAEIGFREISWKEDKRYLTSLAPMCATIGDEAGVQWLLMRKIELEGGTRLKVPVGKHPDIAYFDIKGPKLAAGGVSTGWKDGKTALSKLLGTDIWPHKDSGFCTAFGIGAVKLHGSYHRDAVFVAIQDAFLLASLRMTDYSLFAALYAPEDEPSSGDTNEAGPTDATKHIWPPILKASWTARDGSTRHMRIALGIIDWVEQKVNADFIGSGFSTMKAPLVFRSWWTQMFGQYFHLQKRSLNSEGLSSSDAGQPTEQFKVGGKVWALQKLKWIDGKNGRRSEFHVHGQALDRVYIDGQYQRHCANQKTLKVYSGQIVKDQCYGSKSGSKYKVEAGREGTIISILAATQTPDTDRQLVVAWDDKGDTAIEKEEGFAPCKKLFKVWPHQVMILPLPI